MEEKEGRGREEKRDAGEESIEGWEKRGSRGGRENNGKEGGKEGQEGEQRQEGSKEKWKGKEEDQNKI